MSKQEKKLVSGLILAVLTVSAVLIIWNVLNIDLLRDDSERVKEVMNVKSVVNHKKLDIVTTRLATKITDEFVEEYIREHYNDPETMMLGANKYGRASGEIVTNYREKFKNSLYKPIRDEVYKKVHSILISGEFYTIFNPYLKIITEDVADNYNFSFDREISRGYMTFVNDLQKEIMKTKEYEIWDFERKKLSNRIS